MKHASPPVGAAHGRDLFRAVALVVAAMGRSYTDAHTDGGDLTHDRYFPLMPAR